MSVTRLLRYRKRERKRERVENGKWEMGNGKASGKRQKSALYSSSEMRVPAEADAFRLKSREIY